jgi:hypothetical protein
VVLTAGVVGGRVAIGTAPSLGGEAPWHTDSGLTSQSGVAWLKALGKPLPVRKYAKFVGLLPNLVSVPLYEVGDDLDRDPDPQAALQIVKLHRRPGATLVGGAHHATSARFPS